MIRLDQNQQKPGEEPDVWHWSKLTQADPEAFTTSFDLPDIASRGRDVAMRINFRGISSIVVPMEHKDNRPTDHLVEVRINGHLLGRVGWNGRDEFKQALSVPVKDLKAAANQLVLSIPKRTLSWNPTQTAVDVVMFNWIEFDYPLGGVLAADSAPLQSTDSSARCMAMTGCVVRRWPWVAIATGMRERLRVSTCIRHQTQPSRFCCAPQASMTGAHPDRPMTI